MTPSNNTERNRRLITESALIQKHFPFIRTRIIGNRLVCRGHMQPSESSTIYRVELVYRPWNAPEVRILNPKIKPERHLHFYRDGTLCLYDWREQPWHNESNLAGTVIPWTAEWLLYYELFLLTGKWLGREATHSAPKQTAPQQVSGEVLARSE